MSKVLLMSRGVNSWYVPIVEKAHTVKDNTVMPLTEIVLTKSESCPSCWMSFIALYKVVFMCLYKRRTNRWITDKKGMKESVYLGDLQNSLF